MADVGTLATASTCFFAATIAGAGLAKVVTRIPGNLVTYANASCGGILMSVAIVHMLSESAGELEGVGKTLNRALGGEGEEPFPVGFLLCGIGFLFITAVERLIIGQHLEEDIIQESEGSVSNVPPRLDEATQDDIKHAEPQPSVPRPAILDLEANCHSDGKQFSSFKTMSSFRTACERRTDMDDLDDKVRRKQIIVGTAAFFGISAHSIIESIATGGSRDQASLLMLMSAILAHKVLTSFAVSVALRYVSYRSWMMMILAFALSGPLGISIGALFASNLEGEQTAALQCLASGTLLAIGVDSMLLPSLDGKAFKSFVCAGVAYLSMSALAAWA